MAGSLTFDGSPRPVWQARDELRRTIIERRVLPGAALEARELARSLRTSLAVAREVLEDLRREGLIDAADGASVVMTPTPAEAEELDDLRSPLQALVVRGFVTHASDSQLRALRRAVGELDRLVRTGAPPASLFMAKEWIYGLLLRGSGNASVIEVLARIRGRVSMLSATALSQPGVAEQTSADFAAILEAIEARDAPAAVRLCRAHLRSTREAGLAGLAVEPGC